MSNIIQDIAHNKAAHAIDASSLAVVIATLMEFISPLAAFASLIWVCMRIYISVLEIIEKHKDKDE